MERPRVMLGKRPLVWIVAAAAAIETFLESVISLVSGNLPEVLIWITGTLAVFGAAAMVEKVQAQEGE